MSSTAPVAGRSTGLTAVLEQLPVELLDGVVEVVRDAGERLLAAFDRPPALRTRADVVRAIGEADAVALAVLRPGLEALRPAAGWVEDELEDGALPQGGWWVVDPVEGAINYVHGLAEWGLTATLVRDNVPVLTVVHVPLTGATYTAVAGRGAVQDGQPLRTSPKTELAGALVGTGQASPRETPETFALIGRSLTAMMAASGVARVSVPPTLQLVHVAAGGMDLFWQHSAVRSGLLAGALLVAEASGAVTDLHGAPWNLASRDFLAAAPGVHAQAVALLAPLA